MEAFFVGLTFVVAIAVALFVGRKISKQNPQYDERQLRIRADGYRLGYFTTIAINFVLVFLYSFEAGINTIMEPALSMFIAIMAGIVVFVIYCIFKDAFFHIDEKAKGYIILLLGCSILNGIIGVSRIIDGTLWENGVMEFTRGGSSLVLTISFLIILIAMTIKWMRVKAEVAE